MKPDADLYQEWLGKEAFNESAIGPEIANLMNATLNREPVFALGDELPPGWHWLYFHDAVLCSELGVEGHPRLGGFMPPVDFGDGAVPRRMWAGGTLTFEAPIHLGDHAYKRSVIRSITPKVGRSGQLCFVEVEHEIGVGERCCLREEQTIVYREANISGGSITKRGNPLAGSAPTDAEFSATYQPDPVMLFRYSALTFNAHRIHYDVDFCRQHEGYPDLVVHGPLTATLLLDLFHWQLPNHHLRSFAFRSLRPLFNPHPFMVNGKRSGDAWVANGDGRLAMTARCTIQ